jgi:hypothetical protein
MLTRPQKETVTLSKINKTVHLNLLTLNDEEWVKDTYGDMNELFKQIMAGSMDDYLRIFWRLLDDEGKRAIANIKLSTWDGTKENHLETDDPIVRLKHIVGGYREGQQIAQAIVATITGKSWPDIEKNAKKKMTVAET